MHKLLCEETGNEIKAGDAVVTFRGERATVIGFQPPQHPASTGRVHIKDAEGRDHWFFPGVINARIVEIK
jgi:hypothetical protein